MSQVRRDATETRWHNPLRGTIMDEALKDNIVDPIWRKRGRGSPMWKNVAAPVILVILFWLASSLITTYYIHWLEDSQARSIKQDLATIRAAGDMRYTMRQLYRVAVEVQRPSDPQAALAMQRLEGAFHTQLAAASATSSAQEERDLVRVIEGAFPAFKAEVHRWVEVGSLEMQTAQTVLMLTQLLDDVAEPCKLLGDVNERMIDEAAAERTQAATTINAIRLGFLIIGPAGGILCGLWIARHFNRSISQISITLSDVASQIQEPVARIKLSPSGDLTHLQEQVQLVSTRIRQVVGELQDARRQAIVAARLAAVGELAAGVAHELRNPLTSVKLLIQTAAQRLPRGALPEKTMRVIQDEIDRMEKTIETLLQFARPPRIKRLPHDVRETVWRALNLVEGRASQSKVALRRDFPIVPVHVDADPEQLHQALINLLINGIEAMPEGGPLSVSLRANEAAGRCQILVEDTGPGIPSHVMERLFEPFVTGKERGTGLGLAISRRIVQENGGTLSGDNRKEGGAVFTVDLPLQQSPECNGPGGESKENSTIGTVHSLLGEGARA
jgi:two-component system, NtrC family, sensor histidine kinase HydH